MLRQLHFTVVCLRWNHNMTDSWLTVWVHSIDPELQNYKPFKYFIHKLSTCWVSKDNIWIEVGSFKLTATRPWLQGFSVLSDSWDVCSQPAPGEAWKTSVCKFSGSVGEREGEGAFYNVIRLTHCTTEKAVRVIYTVRDVSYQKHWNFFCCSRIVLSWFRFCAGFSAWLPVIQTSHISLVVF